MQNPLTTAAQSGVIIRYVTAMLGSVVALLGVLGFLSEEQVRALTEQAPVIMTALGSIVSGAVVVYAAITKSSSDKAAEVAKQVDAQVAPAESVTIKTPEDQPDIVVAGTK